MSQAAAGQGLGGEGADKNEDHGAQSRSLEGKQPPHVCARWPGLPKHVAGLCFHDRA